MGLFSTLKTSSSSGPATSSSADIPTVVQLYTDAPILLDTATSKVTAYTAMTYQAVQVGSSSEELKNKHQNPDLGIWNCAVKRSVADDKAPLVDHILNRIIASNQTSKGTYVLTVNLCGGENALSKVEPTISLLQEALIRHFIEHPPSSTASPATAETVTEGEQAPEAEEHRYETATTSLFQLKSTQFGIALEDKKTSPSNDTDESDQDAKCSIMICAVLPTEPDESATEVAYRTKQAQELVIYHLRKFAYSIDASLCFVAEESNSKNASSEGAEAGAAPAGSTDGAASGDAGSATVKSQQATISLADLGQLWKDLALDKPVWGDEETDENSPLEENGVEPAATALPTSALYGPGKHQEDLIDSVLLRNAHCPGHWDASKDSLWVALPTVETEKNDGPETPTGDQGWMTQLRDSVASAVEQPRAAAAAEEKEGEPEKKDAAVSSFFANLLKDP